MPIVDVSYAPTVPKLQLSTLSAVLPHIVSLAVECPEEPYDGNLSPGDVELRFHQRSPYDAAGLDILLEVRSKWFASRADDRHDRCERVRDVVVEAIGARSVGVYLSLPVAGWAQTG